MGDDIALDESTLLNDPALAGYAIQRELGGGGMARLFLATDRQFDRTVVIKILTPSDVGALSIDRFRREIAVATSLQHPNIVPILGAGELNGEPRIPFFVMPFVEGEALRERLLRGPLSVREAVNIARDITRALRYAHDRGIVHRDIKPGNVLLAAGAAVVSDFGVAKALLTSRKGPKSGGTPRAERVAPQTLTTMGTSLGTPAYMAPEQAAADPNVDHRADIYAFGIVLYEMLAGTTPFHGRTPRELLRAQLADPPPPIATRRYDVPPMLAALIARCLEKDPAMRPKTATEVLGWLDDPGVTSGSFTTTPKSSNRFVRLFRTHRSTVLGAIGLAAFASLYAATYEGASGGATAKADSAAAGATSAASVPTETRTMEIGPLTPIGGDAPSRLLADALGSELANAMAGVTGMRVVDSGGALRVQGTIQRERTRFRVLLRLLDNRTNSLAWSGAVEGSGDSLLALQQRVADELARGAATVLQRP